MKRLATLVEATVLIRATTLRPLLALSARAAAIAWAGASPPTPAVGVWNNSTSPPWSSDYHTDINLRMNRRLAARTGLGAPADPFVRFVEQLRAPGERSARTVFGTPGWVVRNGTNPSGFTGSHDWATAFWFPAADVRPARFTTSTGSTRTRRSRVTAPTRCSRARPSSGRPTSAPIPATGDRS